MNRSIICCFLMAMSAPALAGEVRSTFDEATGILELTELQIGGETYYVRLVLSDPATLTFTADAESAVVITPTSASLQTEAGDIVGAWKPSNGLDLRFTFSSDGSFEMFQGAGLDNEACPNGGTESGTYDWTPSTGIFRSRIAVDGNGQCGTSNPGGAIRLIPAGGGLDLYEGSQKALTLIRL